MFRVLSIELDRIAGLVNLVLQEESSASYDWTAADDENTSDIAPNTNLPDPFLVGVPGNPVITEELYTTTNGSGVKERANLSWAAADDAFVVSYEVLFKLTSSSVYITAGITSDLEFQINDIAPGTYDFQIRSINTLGQKSANEGALTSAELFGLTAPPADITNFSITEIDGTAFLTWDQAVDLDVRVGGVIRLRWSNTTSGATWSNSTDISDALPGVTTLAAISIPATDGTFLIKAVDSSGNESENATTAITTNANISSFQIIRTAAQQASFTGTKTNMVVDGSNLELTESGGEAAASGQYQFYGSTEAAEYIDLGDVYAFRASINIASTVADISDLFDAAPGLFDDKVGLFDGEDAGQISSAFEASTTSDDPSGSPTWSDYSSFFTSDFNARAIRVRLVITNSDVTFNISISTLELLLSVKQKTVSAEDVSVSASGLTVTYDTPFFNKPALAITVQDADTGDYFRITSASTTGFTVTLFNSSDTAISGTIDYNAFGY